MKIVLLAGGHGTRISEETGIKPKPMVVIGNKPVLWHIMKIFSAYGFNEFIICCGYKGEVIKQYFSNYFLASSDITFNLKDNEVNYHKCQVEPWQVTLVDTGLETMTGGRIKRIKDYIDGETFCLTYGDGVSNVDINQLIEFHRQQKSLVTLTAVKPPGRFGVFHLKKDETKISRFREKSQGDDAWINGGFFIIEPEVIDYIEGDSTIWEQEPLRRISQDGQLSAYRHHGFWQNMDTLRDKMVLEHLWNAENLPPWKIW